MQSIVPHSIREELIISPQTKIVFWTLFHYNLIPDFIPINGLRFLHYNFVITKKSIFYFIKIFYAIYKIFF